MEEILMHKTYEQKGWVEQFHLQQHIVAKTSHLITLNWMHLTH